MCESKNIKKASGYVCVYVHVHVCKCAHVYVYMGPHEYLGMCVFVSMCGCVLERTYLCLCNYTLWHVYI